MKKIKLLTMAMLCAMCSLFTSCEVLETITENSITNTWAAAEEYNSYTRYYIYDFSYDDTYTYEVRRVNSSGGEVTESYSYGLYEFSNYNKELILYPSNSSSGYLYDAYISNGNLYIKELYDDGYYYYTKYYKQ